MSTTEITPAPVNGASVPKLEGVETERYTYTQIKHTIKATKPDEDDEINYYGVLEDNVKDELAKNENEKYKGKETWEVVASQTVEFPKPTNYKGISEIFQDKEDEAAAMTYRGLKVKFQNYLRTALAQTDEGEPTFEFVEGTLNLIEVARSKTNTRGGSIEGALARMIGKSVGDDPTKKAQALEALRKQLALLESM